MIFLILALGFTCEGKAQKDSEIYYYEEVGEKSNTYQMVQIQDYGKKMIQTSIPFSKGDNIDEKIQRELGEKWQLYTYTSRYSIDNYDIYLYKTKKSGIIDPFTGFVNPYSDFGTIVFYYGISKDKRTMLEWVDKIDENPK